MFLELGGTVRLGGCRTDMAGETPGTWWVDDAGGWHICDYAANDRENPDPFNDLKMRNIAFHQLGLIRVRALSAYTEISWDLNKANEKGLESALKSLLAHSPSKPVKLAFYYSGWCHESFRSVHDALRRACHVRALRGERPAASLYVQPFETSLIRHGLPSLQQGMACWDNSGGRLDLENFGEYGWDRNRLQVFSLQPDSGSMIVEHVGRRTPMTQILGESWRRKAIGMIASESHDDQAYEDAITVPYWQVHKDGRPYYDHIRALVRFRENQPIWTTYQRLILPLFRKGGEMQLAVITQLTPRVSIPFPREDSLAV